MPPDTTHIAAQQPHDIPAYYIIGGDTVYIKGQTGPPPVAGDRNFDSSEQDSLPVNNNFRYYTEQPESTPYHRNNDDGEEGWVTIIKIILFAIVVIGIHKFPDMLASGVKEMRKRKLKEIATRKQSPYDDWLEKYNPYYASLSPAEKDRFLNRVVEFISSKQFRFHSMVEEEYIVVLVSGAAVQITFGLPNYLMDYFSTIHIIRKEYVLNVDSETYYGHVSRSGIYIAWNRFLEGYENYNDSVNLGIHEMAHAISFDAFLGTEEDGDASLRKRFSSFAEAAKPVFREMRAGTATVLDFYAMENMDEFWAVSVETFFENSERFRDALPGLYNELVEILNQDPLKPGKIVNYRMLGLGNDQA